jgi:hypothetical protein
MPNSPKTDSESNSTPRNKSTPGFFLKHPVALALGIVLAVGLVTLFVFPVATAWFAGKCPEAETREIQNVFAVPATPSPRPAHARRDMETQTFPITEATAIKMFQSATITTVGVSLAFNEDLIKDYFQRQGIPFNEELGVELDYDGNAITVTHTRKNLDRIREILRQNDKDEETPPATPRKS